MRLILVLSFLAVNRICFTSSLKCHLTGYPFPKECSFLIHERHGTIPACLTATVLDDFKNPVEIRKCSQSGSRENPGGCELLHKRETVKVCSICQKDYCNAPDAYSKANRADQSVKCFYIMQNVVIFLLAFLLV